jgi:hypothetical protein
MTVNFVPPKASLNCQSEHPVPAPQYEYPSVYKAPSALLSTLLPETSKYLTKKSNKKYIDKFRSKAE